MTKAEIIEELAKNRTIERHVAKVTKSGLPLHGDAADLAQICYCILLDKPEPEILKIRDINKYAMQLVMNNLTKSESRYQYDTQNFLRRTRSLTPVDADTISNDRGL